MYVLVLFNCFYKSGSYLGCSHVASLQPLRSVTGQPSQPHWDGIKRGTSVTSDRKSPGVNTVCLNFDLFERPQKQQMSHCFSNKRIILKKKFFFEGISPLCARKGWPLAQPLEIPLGVPNLLILQSMRPLVYKNKYLCSGIKYILAARCVNWVSPYSAFFLELRPCQQQFKTFQIVHSIKSKTNH